MRIRLAIVFLVKGAFACGGSGAPTAPSSGSSRSNSGGTSSNGNFSATIDGSAFNPKTVTARHHLGAGNRPDENFGVDAVDAGNNLLSFEVVRGVEQLLTLGLYNLGGGSDISAANYVTVGGLHVAGVP